ncbi:MAG: CDP-diacylglycerol--glycerol-3-phosphate 3-phosphatidyltransferase [Planctomycetota bacterium]|nr:CDP-diacylglycerol--glycerol-3-phosphate 3-phosphatidyltransferase [Planctomycetota bacterium]
MRMTVSNALTIARALGSILIFALFSLYAHDQQNYLWAQKTALPLFIIFSATDLLDGILARRLKQETTFGRIADPFVDKLLVCGSFIFLATIKESLITPWVLIIIISREFLVSGLRSYIEGKGLAFGAMFSGKVKVTAQYTTVGWLIFYTAYLTPEGTAKSFTIFSIYAVSIITLASTVTYIHRAVKLLKGTKLA